MIASAVLYSVIGGTINIYELNHHMIHYFIMATPILCPLCSDIQCDFYILWLVFSKLLTTDTTDMPTQGWFSSGRNLFLPGHPEKSGRNLFLPVLSGQNWKKLDKTGKNYDRGQNCWKKIIIILNYLQKIIMIMVTNAFGKLVLSKTMMQKINYFWPISSKTGRNWMTIGETLKFVRNAEKNLIIMLIFSQKVMVTNALSWLQPFRNLI